MCSRRRHDLFGLVPNPSLPKRLPANLRLCYLFHIRSFLNPSEWFIEYLLALSPSFPAYFVLIVDICLTVNPRIMPQISLLRRVELLLGRIYRLDEPSVVRDRPMKVLALGLSRCGTESLKFALEDLGYKGVYHGFEVEGDQSIVWTRLWDAKVAGVGGEIGVDDFDRLIGNYEAVTDAPGSMFAKELIKAYPDAKVRIFF